MSFLFPLIYFITSTGLLVLIFKKSFAKCLPLSFIISAFIIYISQFLFKTFLIGIGLNLILCFTFISIVIYKIIKQKNFNEFKNLFFSKGLYIFIIIYIAIFFFDLYREFCMWDEFSHWGVMVKEMFRLDKFYSISTSTLMVHKDYPPILQCYEYFYSYISGGYSEYNLIKSLHLIEFSLLIPLFENNDKNIIKSIIRSLLSIGSIYLLIMLFDKHGVINTIYTDYFMSLLVVYILAIIFFNKSFTDYFNIINISISSSFLLLTKQMGLPLYLMIVFFFIICMSNNIIKTNHPIFKLTIVIFSLLIPIFFYTSWNGYVNNLNIKRQFDLKKVEITKLEEYQKTTFHNFENAINKKSIINSSLKISYLGFMILSLIILIFITFFYKKYLNVAKIIKLNITLTLGFYGYAIVMLFLYVFCFGEIEGPTLSSFDRYMATYTIIAFILIITILNDIVKNKNERKRWICTFIILLIMLLPQSFSNYKKIIPAIKKSGISIYEKCANDLKDKQIKGKVYIVAQNSEGQFEYRIKYYADDIVTNKNHYEWQHLINEEIISITKDYDYIYFAQIDNIFIEEYNKIFKNLKNYNLYRIDKDEYMLITK